MGSVLLILIVIAAVMFLWMIAWGVFWFLVQAGVVAQKAFEPPATDTRSFSLDQGREVKSEE
jgi:flagellar basal body-associated protein FliL